MGRLPLVGSIATKKTLTMGDTHHLEFGHRFHVLIPCKDAQQHKLEIHYRAKNARGSYFLMLIQTFEIL